MGPQSARAYGAERWHFAQQWPPPGRTNTTYFFGALSVLVPEAFAAGADEYVVNEQCTTGRLNRWNLVQHMFRQPITYPNRKQQDALSLVYTTPPLKHGFTVTGAVRTRIFLELLDGSDATVRYRCLSIWKM